MPQRGQNKASLRSRALQVWQVFKAFPQCSQKPPATVNWPHVEHLTSSAILGETIQLNVNTVNRGLLMMSACPGWSGNGLADSSLEGK